MAQERDELLDHEYDGIREYDNPLPRWWLWLFYGTIAFALVYTPYYLLGFGPSTVEMYEVEQRDAQAHYPRYATAAPAPGSAAADSGMASGDMTGGGMAGGGMTSGGMVHSSGVHGHAPAPGLADPSMAGDAQAIAAGATIFQQNCLPCHGDRGQGLIGPNLTDRHWIHGNRFEDIVQVIAEGVPDKGMIAWKNVLNPQRINEAAAFVVSIRGTNPPNPKAPQGHEFPE